jgi:hypothetical protein
MIIPAKDSDPREALFAFANEKGLSILTMAREERKLEELFRSLTT